MRSISKLGSASILAASLSGMAAADPQLGSWSSEAGDFEVGNWVEEFTGGGVGMVDNTFSAEGLDACCFALVEAVMTGSEMTGDSEGVVTYEVTYEGASLTLPNIDDLPWYSGEDGADPYVIESMVLTMNLAVTLDVDDAITNLRFDVTGSGAPTGFPEITVSFSAHYEGLPQELAEGDGLEGLLDGASIIITRSSMVRFDIKPWSCINPVNVKSRGVLPAVIAGSDTFDVTSLDVASVRLAGVAPVRSAIGDIMEADTEAPCDAPVPDGIDDLVIKFSVQELMDAIGGHELEHRSDVILPLTVNISNEEIIQSQDTIRLINNIRKPAKGEGKPDHAGEPTEPGNQGNGKGWGPDNNPSSERGNGKGNN